MRCLGLFTISLLLSLSILGPSVILMVSNINQEQKMLVDLGEEESKKENKKEIEQDNFFEFTEDAVQIFIVEDITINHRYLVKKYPLAQEITSPPPEYTL